MNAIPSSPSPRPLLRRVAQIVIGIVVLLLCLSAAAGYLLLDNAPAYTVHPSKHDAQPPLTSQDIKQASGFLKRISKSVINARQTISLRVTQQELNNTLALTHYSNMGLSGYIELEEQHAAFFIAVRVPALGNRFYINARARLDDAQVGLQWKDVQLGAVSLPDGLSNYLFHKAVQVLVGKRYGKNVISGIHDLAIRPDSLQLSFTPPNNIQSGFAKAAERLSTYSGNALHFDSERVQHYLAFLVDHTRTAPNERVSASLYLQLLLSEAQQQTELLKLNAADENLSALYALTVQAAPGVFRHFVDDLKVHRLNATRQPRFTLGQREDLAKHFLYSAALHILAEKGLSFSIGEVKEMMDSDQGGSGFSFADLAADRAGIRFAELATSTDSAHTLQAAAQNNLSEGDFFPSMTGLPEGLSEHAFNDQFSSTNSQEYTALLQEIDTRIDALPLYNTTNTPPQP